MNINQLGLPSPISPITSNMNTNNNFYNNPNNQSNNENNFESITLKTEEIPGSDIHKQKSEYEENNDNNTDYDDHRNNYKTQNTLQLDSNPNTNLISGSNKIPYTKKMSDNTFNDFLSPNNRDSRLNLSISRISLKNNFQDTTSSKLRSVYKKQNENSILNITNVNAKENQFIKFFTNNSLYDGKGNGVDLNSSTKKDKAISSAQTAKKLASDVIGKI